VLAAPKPKVYKGQYYPDDACGVYGIRKKYSFAVLSSVKPVISDIEQRTVKPFFIIDPTTGLAMPVANYKYVKGTKLEKLIIEMLAKLEVATQKRYVKNMTKKALDVIEMLITAVAGLGGGLFILHLIGVITGNQVVI
jgi:hypothetical protein